MSGDISQRYERVCNAVCGMYSPADEFSCWEMCHLRLAVFIRLVLLTLFSLFLFG